ncbi:Zf-rvt domain-containing protein, partial [Thalictrum thalictroides]
MKQGLHQVNSRTLTKKKHQGGLNITDLEVWNRAAVCGLVHRLATRQPGLWVEWMWGNKVKNKEFWSMKVPQDCSWAWRKILTSRADAKRMMKWNIKDGSKVKFWHDLWATDATLASLVTDQVKNSSGISDKATVDTFIHNHNWDLANTVLPHHIQELILQVEINNRAEADELVWTATTS